GRRQERRPRHSLLVQPAKVQSCGGNVPLNGSGRGFAASASSNVLNHGHTCWLTQYSYSRWPLLVCWTMRSSSTEPSTTPCLRKFIVPSTTCTTSEQIPAGNQPGHDHVAVMSCPSRMKPWSPFQWKFSVGSGS